MNNKNSIELNWELIPRKGLGKISFGCELSQIGMIEELFGKFSPIRDSSNQMNETYELLKGIVPEEDILELMKQMESIETETDVKRQEFINENGLTISFENGLLTDFFADDNASGLHFGGIPIFSSDPLVLIRQMANVLSEIPVGKEHEIVFPKNHLYLYGFLNENGSKSTSNERTINWRNSPRILSVSLDDYQELNLG